MENSPGLCYFLKFLDIKLIVSEHNLLIGILAVILLVAVLRCNESLSTRKVTEACNSTLRTSPSVRDITLPLVKTKIWKQIDASTTIKITFSSCTNLITRKLYYNQSIHLSKASNSSTISIQCAPIGRYDLILQAKEACIFELKTILHHPNENWPLLHLIEPSKMHYQNRIKKKQMVVKWNRSKLDIHAVHYCLVINTKRNQRNLCEAIANSTRANEMIKHLCFKSSTDPFYQKKASKIVKIDPDSDLVTITCTGRKNRQILKGLTKNKKYFVDLFGIHTKLENLTFLLNSSFVWYNRTRPIVLRNNSLTTFHLPESGRQAVATYKVPLQVTSKQLKLRVIPCGRNVRLKIIKQSNQNSTLLEFSKASTIIVENQPGERFIFKFSSTENQDNRLPRKIRVMISSAETLSELPELPQNTSLEQDFDETDCTLTSIAWHPSPDFRPDIWYCVYLIEIGRRPNYFDDFFLPNMCIIGTPRYYHPQLYQMQCIHNPTPRKKNNKLQIHHTLTQLNPRSYYAVHVMLRLNNISLPYDKLLISTKSKCMFGLNNHESHLDNHRK